MTGVSKHAQHPARLLRKPDAGLLASGPRASGRTIGRWTGIAAALAFAASGAGAPGLAESQAPLAGSEAMLGVQIAAHAALPAAQDDIGAVQTPEAAAPEATAEEIGSGMASWYGPKFKGRRTASGERFDPTDYTAAHRSLPFGSRVRVTNEATGQSVVVRINDRGPFARERLIDVSQAAARDLGLIGPGHGEVSLALLDD